jgi:hypothetical protein
MELERNVVWLHTGNWRDKEVVDSVDDIENADRISFREACLLHVNCAIKLRHPKRTLSGSPPPIGTVIGFEWTFGENPQLATRLLGQITGQPWLKKPFTLFRQGTSEGWKFPACEALVIYCGETAYADSGFLLYGVQREKPERDFPAELRKLADELEAREAREARD